MLRDISDAAYIADLRYELLHCIEIGVVACHANGNAREYPMFRTRCVVAENLMKQMRGGPAQPYIGTGPIVKVGSQMI